MPIYPLSLPPSKRLRDVLASLARGCSVKEVAAELGISPNTASQHVRRLYIHYGVSTRAELLCLWVRLPDDEIVPEIHEGALPIRRWEYHSPMKQEP